MEVARNRSSIAIGLCSNPSWNRASAVSACGALLALTGVWFATAQAAGTTAAYRVEITTDRASLKLPLVVSDLPGGRVPSLPVRVRVSIDPAPAAVPEIAWSASGGADVAHDGGPNYLEILASPDAIYVKRRIGSPVNRSITVPAFAYSLAAVGCAFGRNDGIAYDRDGEPQPASRPEDADIYVTGPDGQHSPIFSGCSGAFVRNTTDFTLHIPGGGLARSTSSALLPTVVANDFTGPFQTSFDASRLSESLLFRTRDGRLVKIGAAGGTGDGISGPTLVANVGGEFADSTFARSARTVRTALPSSPSSPVQFTAKIEYVDKSTGPYAPSDALELAFPYRPVTPFVSSDAAVRVAISPTPYRSPDVQWRVSGNTVRLATRLDRTIVVPGDHAGRATLVATVGSPLRRTITRSVIAYDSLVLFAGGTPHGVRFTQSGFVDEPNDRNADVYLSSDSVLHFPAGGIMVTDGSDPQRRAPPSALAAPPFVDVTAASWRSERTTLDLAGWREVAGPCYVPVSLGVERLDHNCTTMSANVLLFKTRDGRFVKWHLVNANGTSIMAGPYAIMVLDEGGRQF